MRTLRAAMLIVVGVSLAPATWASAPSLARAYSRAPAPPLAWLVDGEEEAKGSPEGLGAPGPLTPATDTRPDEQAPLGDLGELEDARLGYLRARKTYSVGIATALAGTVLFVPALYVTAIGAFAQSNNVATVGAIGMVVSAGAAVGGVVAANVGAMTATSAAQYAYGSPIARTASVVGLVALGAGFASSPLTLWVGPVVAVGGGLIGAVVQMRQANDALHQVGLASCTVVPMAHGLALVGRF